MNKLLEDHIINKINALILLNAQRGENFSNADLLSDVIKRIKNGQLYGSSLRQWLVAMNREWQNLQESKSSAYEVSKNPCKNINTP